MISKKKLRSIFKAYSQIYGAYYEGCKRLYILNPNSVILFSGVQTTSVSADFYINVIHVIRGVEVISEYIDLSKQETFDIEYWSLEEAKLQRLHKPKVLISRVALITGAAGGIGRVIADQLIAEKGQCRIDEYLLKSFEWGP